MAATGGLVKRLGGRAAWWGSDGSPAGPTRAGVLTLCGLREVVVDVQTQNSFDPLDAQDEDDVGPPELTDSESEAEKCPLPPIQR